MSSLAFHRRHVLLSLAAVGGLTWFPLAGRRASAAADAFPEGPLRDAAQTLIGEAKPVASDRVVLDVPATADNGNVVPFSVVIDSPMTETDFVRAVHVLGSASPEPRIITFRFTRFSGRAAAASRMRLAKSQDIVVLAELGSGEVLMARRPVTVTLACCGG